MGWSECAMSGFAVFSLFVISKYSQNYPFWLELVKKYFQIWIFTKINIQVQLLCWKNMLKSEFYRCFGARIDARYSKTDARCSKKFSDRFSSMLELGSMLERRWESSLDARKSDTRPAPSTRAGLFKVWARPLKSFRLMSGFNAFENFWANVVTVLIKLTFSLYFCYFWWNLLKNISIWEKRFKAWSKSLQSGFRLWTVWILTGLGT